MKNNLYIKLLNIALLLMAGLIASCDRKPVSVLPPEEENTAIASSMDLAITNMHHYNDSCVVAKNHSSPHLHHYDSIYHHHDSIYTHHHTSYHHGDTAHQHAGWHHGTKQHNSHDSLNYAHHKTIH